MLEIAAPPWYCSSLNEISGPTICSVTSLTWNRFPNEKIADWLGVYPFVETSYLETDMCKSESSWSHESRAQSADSSNLKLAANLELLNSVDQHISFSQRRCKVTIFPGQNWHLATFSTFVNSTSHTWAFHKNILLLCARCVANMIQWNTKYPSTQLQRPIMCIAKFALAVSYNRITKITYFST